ncbi:MAG: riboflavin synthase [Melioribacteraceae bacterium]|nr:riboflavin synthase [Melioribacteraceae bacterium]
MFTGLIEQIGEIHSYQNISGGKRIKIFMPEIFDDLKIMDSVCVNGVCLTVTEISGKEFTIEAVGTTLEKSTFSNTLSKSKVNLERAMKLSDRLGGHIVQGHVNGIGTIHKIVNNGENWFIEIKLPADISHYFISEGSIAIDGISLTIAEKKNDIVTISVIPFTWQHTNLHYKKIGENVNIEIDIISKYVENFLMNGAKKPLVLTEERLRELGY